MRVATSNVHASVDGRGRLTDAVLRTAALDADLLFCQELFRGERDDQLATLTRQGTLQGIYVALGHGERVTQGAVGHGWQSSTALFTGESGLFFDEHHPLSPRAAARRERANGREPGDWGIAIVTRFATLDQEIVELGRLPRDKVPRKALLVTLDGPKGPFVAVAVHGAHLSHGSLSQYRQLRTHLASLNPAYPVIMGGDFNSWRPPLRLVLPGWRSAVHARTWPAWRPHSQIDHLLLRGPWRASDGHAVRTGSDHRALVVNLALD